MPGHSNSESPLIILVTCVDDRMDNHEEQFKQENKPNRVLSPRVPGGGPILLTCDSSMDVVIKTVKAGLSGRNSTPPSVSILLVSHTGTCLGLQGEYGDECDERARRLLPDAESHLLRVLRETFRDKGYPPDFFDINSLCVDP